MIKEYFVWELYKTVPRYESKKCHANLKLLEQCFACLKDLQGQLLFLEVLDLADLFALH